MLPNACGADTKNTHAHSNACANVAGDNLANEIHYVPVNPHAFDVHVTECMFLIFACLFVTDYFYVTNEYRLLLMALFMYARAYGTTSSKGENHVYRITEKKNYYIKVITGHKLINCCDDAFERAPTCARAVERHACLVWINDVATVLVSFSF